MVPSQEIAGARHDSNERHRFFDRNQGLHVVKVLPGAHYVSSDPQEMITTVLGSCVAACIHDPVLQVGGMNHFMLPESESGKWGAASSVMRFGNHAMEVLLNDLLHLGAHRARLEIKIFGGANVIRGTTPVGDMNCTFVRSYLQREGLRAVAEDLGGMHPRRLQFFPTTGKVRRQFLSSQREEELASREALFRKSISSQPVSSGDIELFDG
jgi:chemotaxis protein CheD